MTARFRERLINTCITFCFVILGMLIVLKVSFNYTKKYYEENNQKQDIFIEKLDMLLDKVNRLDKNVK